jgi:hypothetical protein
LHASLRLSALALSALATDAKEVLDKENKDPGLILEGKYSADHASILYQVEHPDQLVLVTLLNRRKDEIEVLWQFFTEKSGRRGDLTPKEDGVLEFDDWQITHIKAGARFEIPDGVRLDPDKETCVGYRLIQIPTRNHIFDPHRARMDVITVQKKWPVGA